MKFPGFCGDSYESQSRLASAARTVNFYPEIVQTENAKAQVVLYPSPGLRLVGQDPLGGEGRGAYAQTGRAFAVYGPKLYEIKPHDTSVPYDQWTVDFILRGTMEVDQNPATMATNGDGGQELAICSGNRLYIFELDTNTFSGPHVTGITMVAYLNGRFVGLDATKSILKVSNILDGKNWGNTTQQAPRDDASDPWLALAVSTSKEVWLMGEHTGSIYYDAGTTFPLQPRGGLLITPGIAAPFSLREVGGSMMWLSHGKDGGGSVVRSRGYNPEIVSTEGLDWAIKRYTRDSTISDAVAYTYEEQGHVFYILNFPTANATWGFDTKTNWWHERGSYNGYTGNYDVWGPQFHMHEFGRHLVVDHLSGRIYEQSVTLFADVSQDQRPLRRLRVAPGLVSEQRRVYYDEFRLYLERGVANQTGPGSNPQLALRLSNDGGKTWGSEWWRQAGKIGEFRPPYLLWSQLGSATDRMFAVHVTDPIPWRIIDAYLTVRMGRT